MLLIVNFSLAGRAVASQEECLNIVRSQGMVCILNVNCMQHICSFSPIGFPGALCFSLEMQSFIKVEFC